MMGELEDLADEFPIGIGGLRAPGSSWGQCVGRKARTGQRCKARTPFHIDGRFYCSIHAPNQVDE